MTHHDPRKLKPDWNKIETVLVGFILSEMKKPCVQARISVVWLSNSFKAYFHSCSEKTWLFSRRIHIQIEGWCIVLWSTMGEKAGQFRIDTSGWSYPTSGEGSWNGVFYPPSKVDELQYYAQRFNNAEINMSFCRLLFKNMLKAGIARLRKGFLLP